MSDDQELASNAGQADDTPRPDQETKAPETGKDVQEDKATEDEGKAEPADEEGSEDDKPKRKRSGLERLRRENERLRAELEARSQTQAPKEASDELRSALKQEAERRVGSAPKEADYADYFDYQRALARHEFNVEQEERRLSSEVAHHQSSAARRSEALQEAISDQAEEMSGAIPDIKEVLAKAGSMRATAAVNEAIAESDNPALLVYHLAKNPLELDRLNRLSPAAAGREIGRIEAGLSLAKPNRTTKAPPPKSPPKGGAAPDSQEARLEAYMRKLYGDRA